MIQGARATKGAPQGRMHALRPARAPSGTTSEQLLLSLLPKRGRTGEPDRHKCHDWREPERTSFVE